MPEIWVAAGILVFAALLVLMGYGMRARTAWSEVALLELKIERLEEREAAVKAELESFKKGVDSYVNSRDERDRIRAVADMGERMERVLQQFSKTQQPAAVVDASAPKRAPATSVGGSETVGRAPA